MAGKGWYPCCGKSNCADDRCSHTVAGNIVLDLGVGGWTNSGAPSCYNCDPDPPPACEDVAGEFTLQPSLTVLPGIGLYGEGCGWEYLALSLCACHGGGFFQDKALLTWITCGIGLGPTTGFIWRARAYHQKWNQVNDAYYESTEFFGSDCYEDALAAGKITLSKTTEGCGISGCTCNGSLPATINVWKE